MGHITFLFGIHNHQPVGNFDWVFKDSYEQCYKPFLDVLERHPGVRCALHHTGPLLEWIEENRPKYFERIAKLVERKQIELLGGGFYEPILTIIPERDAVGQIQMMSAYCKEKFGVAPRGMWLAERVWEPHLPALLKKAGMEYTLLDDTHFAFSGLQPEDMVGYYVTEEGGATLNIFPIDKMLRYAIPFKLPEETIRYLGAVSVDEGVRAVSMADDGEKFGLWPGTHKWVYDDGYLERLFGMLEENSGWIHMQTYSEYMAANPPTGRVYLPTASYYEMMEWALPPQAAKEYDAMIKSLSGYNVYERFKVFLRGGFWRNFLVKYTESHHMRSKMCHVSKLVESARKAAPEKDNTVKEAQKYLWRGQCNCPYWHGLFGGIYLNYLRYAIYNNLLKAETVCDRILHGSKSWIQLDRFDYDRDGLDEVLISTARADVIVDPDYGGSLIEWDNKLKGFNVCDTITRREEVYHDKIREDQKKRHAQGDQPQSIHDIHRMKEAGLENILFYDWYQRQSFLDHFLGEGTTLDRFKRCQYPEEGDFVNQRYDIVKAQSQEFSARVELVRKGHLYRAGQKNPLQVNKTYAMDSKGTLNVTYALQNLSDKDVEVWFGVELNLTLLAGDAADRYYVLDKAGKKARMNSEGATTGVSTLKLVDEYAKMAVELTVGTPCDLWRFPIETVSQSESGYERTYQGSCLLLHWRQAIGPKVSKTLTLTGSFEEI